MRLTPHYSKLPMKDKPLIAISFKRMLLSVHELSTASGGDTHPVALCLSLSSHHCITQECRFRGGRSRRIPRPSWTTMEQPAVSSDFAPLCIVAIAASPCEALNNLAPRVNPDSRGGATPDSRSLQAVGWPVLCETFHVH